MRNVLFLLVFVNVSFAQEVSLELSRENIILRGIPVPIKATIENTKCKDVIIKSKDAEITKYDDCKFRLTTISKSRELLLSFYKKTGKDTVFVDKKIFRIKDIPRPIPTVAGRGEGEISEETFKSVFSIGRFDCFSEYIHMDFKITEFTIMIVRNNQSIGISRNIGNRASEETKKIIQLVKAGDKVYIVGLKSDYLNEVRELDEIKFDIIE